MLILLTALLASGPGTTTAPGLPDGSLGLAPGASTEFVTPEGHHFPLTVLRSEMQASGTEVWVARVGDAGSFNRAIVTSGHGATFGWISTPEGDWQITPSEAGGPSILQRAVLAEDEPVDDVLHRAAMQKVVRAETGRGTGAPGGVAFAVENDRRRGHGWHLGPAGAHGK